MEWLGEWCRHLAAPPAIGPPSPGMDRRSGSQEDLCLREPRVLTHKPHLNHPTLTPPQTIPSEPCFFISKVVTAPFSRVSKPLSSWLTKISNPNATGLQGTLLSGLHQPSLSLSFICQWHTEVFSSRVARTFSFIPSAGTAVRATAHGWSPHPHHPFQFIWDMPVTPSDLSRRAIFSVLHPSPSV